MSFLPDVKVRAKHATARASTPKRWPCTWRGKSIADVLAMNVDEAVEFFAAHRVHPSCAARCCRTWAWAI